MNEKDRVLGKKMREAFGAAPDACRSGMRDTLAGLKEDQSMKKGSLGLVLAIALLVILCGSAIAARQLGVLDFLFAGEADERVEQSVQSTFTQTGGDLGPVRAAVRDAVSDGIAVHMVVAYEAVDAQDVVLMEYDADADEQGKHVKPYPHPGEWVDSTRKWVVWHLDAEVEGQPVLSGVEYRYESAQVLLVQYVIDLEALERVPQEIQVQFTPGVYDVEKWEDRGETKPITVSLAAGDMEKQVVRAAQEVEFSGIRLTGLEAILTPLATYVTLDYEVFLPVEQDEIEEAYRRWSDAYSNLWFDLLDASGEPLPHLTGGRKYDERNDIHPIQERVKMIFTALPEKPASMTFAPYVSGTVERLPAFTVPVE